MEVNKFNYKTIYELEEKLNSLPFELEKNKNEIRKILSAPLEAKNFMLKNRIAIQPMEGFDSDEKYAPSFLTKRRYDRFAKSGASLIWYEAVAVVYEGRSNSKQLCINKDNADSFKGQVEMIKTTCFDKNGFEPLVIMQATHSGRYSKPDDKPAPVIAYNKPLFEKNGEIPRECIISADELERLTLKMGEAAKLAEECGFDGVDIKCCHGYLNNELLSAFNRGDRYGGDFLNRTRFYTESIKAARAATKKLIVTSRLNAYDGFNYPDGFAADKENNGKYDLTETKKLISILHNELELPLLNITCGNPYVNPHVNRPADILPYDHPEHPLRGIERIVKITGELQKEFPDLPIMSSAITYLRQYTPSLAASMIKNCSAQIIGFGRMAFAYPDFASDILETGELSGDKCCVTCGRCSLLMRNASSTGCVIRDSEHYYPLYKKYVLKEG